MKYASGFPLNLSSTVYIRGDADAVETRAVSNAALAVIWPSWWELSDRRLSRQQLNEISAK